jgi:hypothetical protein
LTGAHRAQCRREDVSFQPAIEDFGGDEMTRRSGYGRSDTVRRLYDIGGPDLALRYLEIAEESRRQNAREEPGTEPAAPPTPRRSVLVNDVRVGDDQVAAMERVWGTAVADGRYWYDAACGAWGTEGGPCVGFVEAGLELGGTLRRDASRGDTGVLINGRELHVLDLAALLPFAPMFPGRYWLDAHGDFGWEGGGRLGNVAAAMRSGSGAARNRWPVSSRLGSLDASGFGLSSTPTGRLGWPEAWPPLSWRFRR